MPDKDIIQKMPYPFPDIKEIDVLLIDTVTVGEKTAMLSKEEYPNPY